MAHRFPITAVVVGACAGHGLTRIGSLLRIGAVFSGPRRRFLGRTPAGTKPGETTPRVSGILGLVVFVIAGSGLLRRRIWGYYAHIVGAMLLAPTCLGMIYTVFAIVHAVRPEFRQAFT